jgi:uncharacterized protein YdhG (YjbR/CyaY superfamily)
VPRFGVAGGHRCATASERLLPLAFTEAGVMKIVMRSTASDVARYIADQPKEWQPSLKQLRNICRKQLRGYTESMAYGMPSYERSGQVEVGFGKQARYLSLYILKQPVFEAHRADLVNLSLGKGCIRYRRPDQIDWAVVSSLLADTHASTDAIC